ncbi:MAG: DUF4386 family protein [Oryzihumus sp.]
MTTSTSPALATEQGAAPEAAQRAADIRRRIAGACLVLAPVAFALAEVLAPEGDGTAQQVLAGWSAHRSAGLAATFCGLVSTMLFIPAIFGLLTPITGRGRRAGHLAAAAMIYGLVMAHAALGGVNLMFYVMTDPSLERSQMLRLGEVLMHQTAVGAPLLLGHLVFSLGVAALGVAIIRSRVFPRWTGVAVLLWLAVDVLAGFVPAPSLAADLLSNAFGIAGLGTIGWWLLSGRTARQG